MMKTNVKNYKKLSIILSALMMLAAVVSGCVVSDVPDNSNAPPFTSYRDIPGLTEQDIQEIEFAIAGNDSFSYAMMLSTEAFIDSNNQLRGYSLHFCDYLTELFGIPFTPVIVNMEQLFAGLEDGSVDFTGTLTATPERQQIYHMTDPIAQRAIKSYRITGSEPITSIMEERMPRYAMLEMAASTESILNFALYEFEPVFIDEYIDAYPLMASGEVDALLAESSVETTFDAMGDVVSEGFFPIINAFVSFTAYRDELAPIVNAVQKLLENGGQDYIGMLYDTGHDEYIKHKLSMQLTPDELKYIAENPIIYFGAEFENYPVSFFDQRSNQWEGVAIDVLDEICMLTGMDYVVVNEIDSTFDELIKMLDNGSIQMLSELIMSPEREGEYLWPDQVFYSDRSVLISRIDYNKVNINRIYSESVGLVKNTAHTEFFNTWFPNHPHTEMFSDHNAAVEALRNGEVDLVMTSYSTGLYLSNYLEETIFTPAVIFDNSFDSTFGLPKNREILLSIVNKAMTHIDIADITDDWLHKTYDYRLSLAEQNNILFRDMVLVMLCVLLLVIALLFRNRHTNRRLGELVEAKTQELARSLEEVSAAKDEADAANKSKSYFLANMSHEIRTPMNAIAGITEIILSNDDLPEELKEGLLKIDSSCDLLMGIINDILDFSKIEAGKLDIDVKEYYLEDLISDSAQLNMMRIGNKPIKFIVVVDENTPVRLIGDELRLKQIMNNLLSNAFKYTEEGEVRLSVTAGQEKDYNNDRVILTICVTDTGFGMTEEQLSVLFDEYTRFAGEQSKRSIEGTGLGLAITERLISLMGGRIEVKSKFGEGSEFKVTLPQRKIDDEVLGKENTEYLNNLKIHKGRSTKGQSIVRDPMPYGRVLVVDDVEPNIYVAIGLMKPYMLQVDTVMSGEETIDKIANGEIYDIIFMDHMMPGMDGIEATAKLRELGYNAPIVALTANAVAGQADMFLENGFDDFIAKPIDIRQLNSVLNRYVRDKQPEDVIEKARRAYSSDGKGENKTIIKDVIAGIEHDESSDDLDSLIELSSEIDGLDVAKGLEKYDNDEDIYFKILRSYIASTRNILDDIEKLGVIDAVNIDDYRIKVHSIKGTSLDLYADFTGKTAAWLEQNAKDGIFDKINEHTPAFLKDTHRLLDELDVFLAKHIAAKPRNEKENPDESLLLQLKEACETYSMDGVNRAMDEIEKYEYTADDGLAVWLRERVNVMDFAQIVERLSQ